MHSRRRNNKLLMTISFKSVEMTTHEETEVYILYHSKIYVLNASKVYSFRVPSQLGKGLSQYPGGLLLGATQVTVDDPFKR